MESEHYCGRWLVFDCRDDDGSVHIAPPFGREHDLDRDCWCHPEMSLASGQIVVHNVEQ